MTEITLFRFENKAVRTATVHGEVVWIAKDVAEGLEYIWKGSASLKHIPEEWRGVTSVQTPSGNQEMAYLTEQGLFFFLGRSDKPKALPFQKWVAGEVIPSIRKTGAYAAPALSEQEIVAQALQITVRQVEELKAENAILAPKAEVAEKIASSDGLYTLNLSAKAAQMPLNQFTRIAHANGFIFKQNGKWNAYSDKVKAGLCYVKFHPYRDRDGDERFSPQVFFTPKGIERIARISGQH
ncbi:phage antirepressor KilAC domain-containing protein [Acetobacter tropicalis]|uniref:phage antirepressor KilAC domain-containing protein n=1 Tax=Acetobacter tropicalis TaxID=104102 RepID=UPI0009EEEBFF|nr:phage antirepressor KilAC domain-containing protein [Acetobacter tropicalis]